MCSPGKVLPEDNLEVDGVRVTSRRWIAWELVLTVACIVLMVSVREAITALRSSVSESSMIVRCKVGGA